MEETLIKRSDISIADFYKMNRDIIGEEVVILDSPLKNSLSKKSYIFFDFRRRIIVKNKEIIDNGINIGKNDPFLYFEKEFEKEKIKELKKTDHFNFGAFLLFAYDCARYIEKLPNESLDDLELPDAVMYFPSQIIIKDEEEGKLYYLGNIKNNWKYETEIEKVDIYYNDIKKEEAENFIKNIEKEKFYEIVEKARNYIIEGDIFQVNLSQRFEAEFLNGDSFELYRVLREINPSPFASYVAISDFKIISQSPERLIRLNDDNTADTRPIAGTRRFKSDTETEMKKELLLSEKECAEHIMLVDLERNDLGKVSKFGSVNVNELMVIERYSHVMHIVSNVIGSIKEGISPFQLIKAMFPGGTITGAPKIRSMEIIEELEPTKRGFYTGSLGYIDFTGKMDINIIIRTFIEKGEKLYFQTGAGIVFDSIPEKEYDETINKARAMILAYKNYMYGGEKNVKRDSILFR